MSCKRIVGSVFFETTITVEVYHDIIQQFISLLRKNECRPHVAKDIMSFLVEFFGIEFASGRHVAQILSLLTFFYRVFSRIMVWGAPWSTAEFKKKTEDVIIIIIDVTMCRTLFTNLLKQAFSCPANLCRKQSKGWRRLSFFWRTRVIALLHGYRTPKI